MQRPAVHQAEDLSLDLQWTNPAQDSPALESAGAH